jgi:hypothetical protein
MAFGADYVPKLWGTEVRAGAPESLDQFIRAEIPRWTRVIRQSGIKVD